MMRSILLAGLLSVGAFASQDILVTPDWQLLGATENLNVSEFDGKCVDFVWAYDSSTNSWQVHVANGQSYNTGGIASLNSIQQGQGFWVKGHDGCNITFNSDSSGGSSSQGYTYDMLSGKTIYSINESNVSDIATITYGVDDNHTRAITFGKLEQENQYVKSYDIDDNGIIHVEDILTVQLLESYSDYWEVEVVKSDGTKTIRRAYFDLNNAEQYIKDNMPYAELEMNMNMPAGESYDSLAASQNSLDLSKTYYDVWFSTHDGVEVESHKFDAGTLINKEFDFENNSWKDEANDTYTTITDGKEFLIQSSGYGEFKIKYLGEKTADEGNELMGKDIFQSGDIGYAFAFQRTKDNYEFWGEYEMKYNDGTQTQYSSIEEFINDKKGAGWWECTGDCSSGGITFAADSDYSKGSGTLIEVDNNGNVTNSNAGTWEIKDVDGKETLVTDITLSDYDHDGMPIFQMDSTGLQRGSFEKAGSESMFFFLNESGKDHFVDYVQANYSNLSSD